MTDFLIAMMEEYATLLSHFGPGFQPTPVLDCLGAKKVRIGYGWIKGVG
jgi:hypothetical protein